MGTPGEINALMQSIAALKNFEWSSLAKTNLGEFALSKELKDRIPLVDKIIAQTEENPQEVPDVFIREVRDYLNEFVNFLNSTANLSDPQFLQQRSDFLRNIDHRIEAFKRWRGIFRLAAMEKRGLFDTDELERKARESVGQVQEKMEEVRRSAEALIKEAEKRSQEIKERAIKTARKISIKEAQDEFGREQATLTTQVQTWAVLSVLFSTWFFITLYVFIKNQKLADNWTWQIAYYTTIRITLLGAIGAISSYCVNMLTDCITLWQLNRHRQRVANSLEALVSAADTEALKSSVFSSIVSVIVNYPSATENREKFSLHTGELLSKARGAVSKSGKD